jgi:signal transduction histidine kinase
MRFSDPSQRDIHRLTNTPNRLFEERAVSNPVQCEEEIEQLRQQNQVFRDAIAFAGHEWRNQLSLLNLATARLMREVGDPTAQQMTLERIRECATVMQRIARNYLDLAQIENGSFRPRYTLVNPVREVIEPVLSSYADLLAGSRQTWYINISRPDLAVWADRDALITVYDNLISNAIKYGEPGGGIIFGVLERGRVDELSVWNSGPGIAAEHLESIGKLFAQPPEANIADGTGVGLYLIRRIVEAHQGCLRVESGPGAGMSVVFTLPRRGTGSACSQAVQDRLFNI